MAYGAAEKKDAAGNVVIPANSALVFDIEMIAISR
jgi:FKBP-type peptidyl-prolyl cis-trans isomerase